MKSYTTIHPSFSLKNILIALSFSFILSGPHAQARPNFTEEELARARKEASEAKYPINFDAVMDEVDRLGVECEGDLTSWVWIEICKLKVESAQSLERIEQSRKRQEIMRQETIRLINEAADIAEKKLQQSK